MALKFEKTTYFRSAAVSADFLRDQRPQIAFAGRSNVGKSSVINALAGRKNLAFVGASPGKTSQINYFSVDGQIWLVDLPGYGYAKVGREERARWGRLMESYFQDEEGLITLGVLLVDARHRPSDDDVTMHTWFRESGCREIVVANKVDKLKPREMETAESLIRTTLKMEPEEPLILFSAEKGVGRKQLVAFLESACE